MRLVEATPPAFSQGFLYSLNPSYRVCVSDCGTQLAPALVTALRQYGVNAELVHTIPTKSDAVIFLGGMRPITSLDDAMRVNEEAFKLVYSLAEHLQKSGGLFITVQNTGGGFGLTGSPGGRAIIGGISALAKCMHLEWPKTLIKSIDIALNRGAEREIGQRIADELVFGGAHREIALAGDGKRYFVSNEPTPRILTEGSVFSSNSVVVVSGAESLMGQKIALSLAARYQCRLVLVGAFSDEESDVGLSEALKGCRAWGSEVRYYGVDLSKMPLVTEIFSRIRKEFGNIHVLIHGNFAGSTEMLEDRNLDSFRDAFRSRVFALLGMLQAMSSESLRALAIFSLNTPREGVAGGSTNAVVSEVIKKLLAREFYNRGHSCVVKAVSIIEYDTDNVELLAQEIIDELNTDPATGEIEIALGKMDRPSFAIESLVDIRVKQVTHSYLNDVKKESEVFVPVGMALNWMFRQALETFPNKIITKMTDVALLKELIISRWVRGALFRLRSESVRSDLEFSGAEVIMTLTDDAGRSLCQAKLCLQDSYQLPTEPILINEEWGGERYEFDSNDVCNTNFSTINSIGLLEVSGVWAEAKSVNQLSWPNEGWKLDIAVFEGVMQVACGWAKYALGMPCRVVEIQNIVFYDDPIFIQEATLRLAGISLESHSGICDVMVVNKGGKVIAAMNGILCKALEDVSSARVPDDIGMFGRF